MRLIKILDYIVTLGYRTDPECNLVILRDRLENFFDKSWRKTMKAKDLIKQFADEIEKASQHEDVITARNNVREVAQTWKREAGQMFDDKENRIIFVVGLSAAFLLGVMIGLFL